MSNYLEKYLKYKSKYQQLKIQKGGAKLGDHTYIMETGQYWGVIVGYKSSVNQYVVLQNSTRERFLKAENEGIIWEVDNSQIPSYPSKSDVHVFIVKNRSRSDVVWFNPEEETQPKISPRGAAAVSSLSPRSMASRDMSSSVSSFAPRDATAVSSFAPRDATAVSSLSPRSMASRDMSSSVSSFSPRGAAAVSSFPPRGMSAPVSSKLTLIELARTNTKFQEWIVERSKSGLTSDLIFESDTFKDLLTHDAFIEMQQSFDQDEQTEWMKVGRQASKLKRPTTQLDHMSVEKLIKEVSSTAARFGMIKYCSDCNKQVNLGTRCEVSKRYHMVDN